jgi:hypothetical protein
VLVELLELEDRHSEATTTLNAAIEHWEKQSTPQAKTNLITLLRAGAAFDAVHKKHTEAAALYVTPQLAASRAPISKGTHVCGYGRIAFVVLSL